MSNPAVAGVASASSSPSSNNGSTGEWHPICPLSSIPIGGKKSVDIKGRPIVIFHTSKPSPSTASALSASSSSSTATATSGLALSDGSYLWAIDRICYHMGGPLDAGDIEELSSSVIVTCPWHRYKISLSSGEGLYQTAPNCWKSKGVRQRTHGLRLSSSEESTAEVLVQISEAKQNEEDVASDSYNAPDRYKAMQERIARPPMNISYSIGNWSNQGPNSSSSSTSGAASNGLGVPTGYMRSGQVFAANRAANAANPQTQPKP